MTPIPFHPYANIFPLLTGREFDLFVEDVRQNGIHKKIELFEEQILDGRNRYRAMLRLFETGVILGPGWGVWAGGAMPDHLLEADAIHHPFTRFYPDEKGDPLAYVESLNIHRRDLTPSQRAACAAEIEVLRHGDKRPKGADAAGETKDANLHLFQPGDAEAAPPVPTREELAERYNVSERSIADAAVVRDEGAPELKEALKQGEIAADAAATIAKLMEPERQTAVLAELPRGDDGKLTPDAKREVRKLAKELREETQAEKRARRDEREREQGQRQLALPDKKYGVILEDPEWDFEVYSRDTGMDRHAANHYAVSPDAALEDRSVIDLAADDCVYGLWTADLARGLDLLRKRGFTFKSYFVWVKDVVDFTIDPATLKALGLPDRRYLQVIGPPGTGFWNRDRDEILLIGVKGNPPCPAMGTQGESVWFAPRPHVEGSDKDRHSAKPDICFEWFNRHFPHFQKIELNARTERVGWDRWGLEAPPSDVDEVHREGPAPTMQEHGAIDEPFDPETGELPPLPWSAGIDADAEAEEAARVAGEGADA